MKRPQVHWAIQHDSVRYNDAPRPSAVQVTGKWLTVMQQILRMPVPKRDEPVPVAGEISAAR